MGCASDKILTHTNMLIDASADSAQHDLQEQFEKDYSAVQRLEMTINYRSTQSIVARSNALIACSYKNPSRAGCQPKALQAAPGAKDNHEVQFVRYRSKETQGQHILECVKWWHDHGSVSLGCLSTCPCPCPCY